MDIAARIGWGLLALVHLLPALAFVRPAQLASLYRVGPDNPLFSLMHHRAALFVVVVILCLWAAADPAVRRLAVIAVGFSMLSFLFIYWRAGQPQGLRTIALVDLIGLAPLALVAFDAFARRHHTIG
jgi:hypothetical protein